MVQRTKQRIKHRKKPLKSIKRRKITRKNSKKYRIKSKKLSKKQSKKILKKGGFIAPLIAAAHNIRCKTPFADSYTCDLEQKTPISTKYQQIPVNTPRYISPSQYQQNPMYLNYPPQPQPPQPQPPQPPLNSYQ